jgi:hypothetical protein
MEVRTSHHRPVSPDKEGKMSDLEHVQRMDGNRFPYVRAGMHN